MVVLLSKAAISFKTVRNYLILLTMLLGAAIGKSSIAAARSMMGDNKYDELLKASQELYKLLVAQSGEENESAIHAGKVYAVNLQKANRGEEARELLMKLLANSKQLLGPHHSTFNVVEMVLKRDNTC